MAWIYVAEEGFSQKVWSPKSGRSPIVRTTDTSKISLSAECSEEKSYLPLFGQISEVFEDSCYRPLMLSQRDFHARMSVLQGLEKAWARRRREFSIMLRDLPLKYRRRLFFSKTPQVSENLFRLSEMRLSHLDLNAGTVSFRPQTSELHTSADDGSLWPTLSATQYGSNVGGGSGRTGKALHSLWRLWKMGFPFGH